MNGNKKVVTKSQLYGKKREPAYCQAQFIPDFPRWNPALPLNFGSILFCQKDRSLCSLGGGACDVCVCVQIILSDKSFCCCCSVLKGFICQIKACPQTPLNTQESHLTPRGNIDRKFFPRKVVMNFKTKSYPGQEGTWKK